MPRYPVLGKKSACPQLYGGIRNLIGYGGRQERHVFQGATIPCGSPDRRDGMGAARDLGYGKYFINAAGGAITDDHQYVISGRNIPSIDIINYDPESKTGFASYWHTQKR